MGMPVDEAIIEEMTAGTSESETEAILNDPDAMEAIEEGLADLENGEVE